ncbi:MAG TPA: WYL domain-containing protein, partial [Actinotalea sp.]|nr:WYL domain-containing protein [Actinotalea sp.]
LEAQREVLAARLERTERARAVGVASAFDVAAARAAFAELDQRRLDVEGDPAVLACVRSALRAGRRLRVRYVDASDRTSEREVDPWQLVTGDDRSYLRAWCHASGGERLFRLDRVLEATEIQVPVSTRAQPARGASFQPAREHPVVRLV